MQLQVRNYLIEVDHTKNQTVASVIDLTAGTGVQDVAIPASFKFDDKLSEIQTSTPDTTLNTALTEYRKTKSKMDKAVENYKQKKELAVFNSSGKLMTEVCPITQEEWDRVVSEVDTLKKEYDKKKAKYVELGGSI